jgi:hypothetical protein
MYSAPISQKRKTPVDDCAIKSLDSMFAGIKRINTSDGIVISLA